MSAVKPSVAPNPLKNGGATPSNSSVTATGNEQLVTVYASTAQDVAQTETVSVQGGTSLFRDMGSTLVPITGSFTVTIPAGQDSVSFGLVNTSTSQTAQTAQVTATLNSDSAVSNTLSVTFNGAAAPVTGTTIPGYTGTIPSSPSTTSPIVSVTDYTFDNTNDSITAGSSGGINIISAGLAPGTGGPTGNGFAIPDNLSPASIYNGAAIASGLFGSAPGNDTISAGGGQSLIMAGSGNDQIYAGAVVPLGTALTAAKTATASNQIGDYIATGNGNSTIVGGNGNDQIIVGSGSNVIVMGAGADTFMGGLDVSYSYVNWTGQQPIGQPTAFTAPTGYEGAQVSENGTNVPLGTGNDTIYGGSGNSTYLLPNGNNYLDAGGGNDTIEASTGNSTIYGGSGSDSIYGGGGNDYINAETGNDSIIAHGGNDTIYGGTGNDDIYAGDSTSQWATSITSNNTVIHAGNGNTQVYGAGGNDTINGGLGNDSLFAGSGNESIQGGDGNTTIQGWNGSSSGSDTLAAGNGNTAILAGSGATTITGGMGSDTLSGGDNTSLINVGDGGTDTATTNVFAGKGNTTINGGAGVDLITGGAGNDVINMGDGGDSVQSSQAVAGSGNTTITGGAGFDNIQGGAGTDSLVAGSGNTSISAGAGNDTMVAGAGTDVFYGGAGQSTYQIGADAGQVTIVNAGTSDVLQLGGGINDLSVVPDLFSNGQTGYAISVGGGPTVFIQGGGMSSAQVGGTTVSFADLVTTSFVQGDTGYSQVNASLPDVSLSNAVSPVVASGMASIKTAASTALSNLTLFGSGDLVGQGNNLAGVITANAGNDTLIAGTGNDTLIGGGASDVYEVGGTSGTVTTVNASTSADTLVFGTGITEAGLSVTTATDSGGGLEVILQTNVGSVVVIDGALNSTASGGDGSSAMLDQIVFANGSTASLSAIVAQSSSGATAGTSAVNVTLAGGVQNMGLTAAGVSAAGNGQSDVLTAGAANDTLIAGTGSDTLTGGGGNTTYEIGAGSGNITIANSQASDILVLGSGVTESGLTTTSAVVNGETITTIAETAGGAITIQGGSLANVRFADGSTATLAQLLSPSYTEGSTTYSQVSATAVNGVTTLAMTGNANVSATANSANDILIANVGSDTLYAGTGNDTLIGGGVSDDYVIAPGSQTTTINQSSMFDTLTFGAGTTLADLSATETTSGTGSTATSQITLINSAGGTVIINVGAGAPVDQITFADGSTASVGAILAQATTGASAASSAVSVTLPEGIQNMLLTGSASITATANELANVITANTGNDTLIAGFGSDTLVGGSNATTYEVDSGSGSVVIQTNDNSDTLMFGTGITEADISASTGTDAYGNPLITIQNAQGGAITIEGGLNQFSFADGTNLTLAQLLAPSYTVGTTTYASSSIAAGAGITELVMTGNANVAAQANGTDITLVANAGNDTLAAGAGNDTLVGNGGLGKTTYQVGSNDGPVTIENSSHGDALLFSPGIGAADLIVAESLATDGSTTVTISDSLGNSIVIGDYTSASLDTLTFNDGSSASLGAMLAQLTTGLTAESSGGSITMPEGVQNLVLTGSGNLTATGNSYDDVITANSGNDQLYAGSANSTLVAGSGNDTLYGSSSGDTTYSINAQAANAPAQTITIDASSSNDTLAFGAGIVPSDVTATTGLAADGVTPITTLTVGTTSIVVTGGLTEVTFANGTDSTINQFLNQSYTQGVSQYSPISATLAGGLTDLFLTGSASITGTGNGANDVIVGNYGNDTLVDGGGNDLLVGAAGNTTFVVSNSNDIILENAGNGGNNTVESSVSFALPANVQNLTLTGSANITGQGGSAAGVITGNSGNDTLIGGSGDDTLVAGSGIDDLIGGSGATTYQLNVGIGSNDTIEAGQSGADVLSFGSGITAAGMTLTPIAGTGSAILHLDSSGDSVTLAPGYATSLTNFQFADGTSMSAAQFFAETSTAPVSVTGNGTAQTIYGTSGNDTLDGGTGDSTLIGGAGVNTYLLGPQNGFETIVEAAGTTSIIELDSGLTLSDISLTRQGNNLVINVSGTPASLMIANYFTRTQGWSVQTAGGQSSSVQSLLLSAQQTQAQQDAGYETSYVSGMRAAMAATYGLPSGDDGTYQTEIYTPASGWNPNTVTDTTYTIQTINTSGSDSTLRSNIQDPGTSKSTYNTETITSTTTVQTNVGVETAPIYLTVAQFEALAASHGGAIQGAIPITTEENNGISGEQPVVTGYEIQPQPAPPVYKSVTTTSTVTTGLSVTGTQTLQIEYLNGSAANTTISMRDGDEIVQAGSGNVLVSDGSDPYAPNYEATQLTEGSPNNYYALVPSAFPTLPADSGNFIEGGTGNDTLIGTGLGDMIIPGNGDNFANGRGGNDAYVATAGTTGWTVIYDSGEELTPAQQSTAQTFVSNGETYVLSGTIAGYKSWGYQDGEWTQYGGEWTGYEVATMPKHVVEFGAGITLSNLTFSWGSFMSDSLHQTLNISWGNDSGFRIALPNSGNTAGFGIQSFEFADGTTMTLAQMIALAPPQPAAPGMGPTLTTPIGTQTLYTASPFAYVIPTHTFLDNGTADTVTYALTLGSAALPAWLSFDPNTNTLTGVGTPPANGTYDIEVTGTDANGLTTTTSFVISIVQGTAPDISTSITSATSIVMPTGTTNLTLTGSASITGTGNNLADTITANSGNDTLIAGSGLATLIGGSGNDTFVVNNASDVITEAANSGNNTEQSSVSVTLAANVQNLTGAGNAPIVLTGNGGNDVISANSGNDTLVAGAGTDTLVGGSGSTTYQVNSNAGNVIIKQSGSSDTLSFGSGIAQNAVTASSSTVNGQTVVTLQVSGGDTVTLINPALTQVSFSGGTSTTLAALGASSTTMTSSISIVMPSGYTSLTLTGTGNISGTGNNLADTITANSGNDTLIAGSGLATLIGGSGNDTFVINNAGDAISESANNGNNTEQTSVSVTLAANVQNLTGTGSAALTLTGNDLDNIITANSGADSLVAGAGNDTLVSGSGVDTMAGGAGNDTFVVNNSGDVVNVSSANAADVVQSSVSYVLPANLANLTGAGIAAITLSGNSGNDVITANGGNDTLVAGSGLATLVGGTGNDTFVVNNVGDVITEGANSGNNSEQTSVSTTLAANVQNLTGTGTASISLTGNNLTNVITANSGNDTLVAGSGLATLNGGIGNDTFVVNNSSDVVNVSSANAADVVQSSVNYVVPASLINLTGTGTAAITLTANGGNDVITANGGNDTLVAGNGSDTLIGGGGNTTYQVNNSAGNVTIDQSGSGDTLAFGSGIAQSAVTASSATVNGQTVITLQVSGGDTVILVNPALTQVSFTGGGSTTLSALLAQSTSMTSSTSVVMPAGYTTLTLTGTGNISGAGNNLADTITANSGNDTLIAGSGLATLIGGSGTDTFVVNNTSDVVQVAAVSPTDVVQTSVNYVLPANLENLTGTGTANLTLTGNNLADTITANSGNDSLVAGSGNTALISGSGVDTMVGGAGNDTFVVNNTGDVISEAANNGNNTEQTSVSVTLASNVQNLTAIGSASLALTGNSGNDVITANSGNDTLIAGGGIATLVGGSGNDTFVVNNGSDVVSVASANAADVVQSSVSYVVPANLVNLTGTGTAAITLTGNSGNDVITANSGNDTLAAGVGLATLVGGSGNDTFVINNVGDVISEAANNGNNTEQTSVSATLAANVQKLTGTSSSNLTLTGNNLGNVITANSGNDTLVAGSGLATLIGGAGNDTFVINNAGDVISEAANSGNNTEQTSVSTTLAANVQNLTGTGTANLSLTGNNLANVITANSGNDTLMAGSGIATLLGGSGNDTFIVNNSGDVVNVSSASAADVVQSSVSYVVPANLVNLTGTGVTAITLTGNSGNDVVTANGSNDTLVAGSGLATLIGGSGNDTFVINNANDVITEGTNSGNNIEQTSVSATLAANVQKLTGTGSSNLTLTGNNLGNVITANSGNDILVAGGSLATLVGGSGNDTFVINNAGDVISEAANSGNNTEQTSVSATLVANVQNLTGIGATSISLTGNNLANVITANSGNDTLVAGSGIATLVGGSGNDTFIVNNGSDVVSVASANAADVAQSSVSYVVPANLVNLTGVGTSAISLAGNSGNDIITANSGNDTLTAGSGIATLVGGAGNDTFVINNSNDAVSVTSAKTGNIVQSSVNYVLPANLLNLSGTGSTAITLTGNALNDVITANGGNDTLVAGSGADTLMGSSGSNTYDVNSNAGNVTIEQSGSGDTLAFGSGIAQSAVTASSSTVNGQTVVTLQVSGGNAVTLINPSLSTVTFTGGVTTTLAAMLAANTSITSSTSIVMPAGTTKLTLTGSASISGTGNNLADTIIANSGNDTLIAGSGLATLVGGSGNDIFVVNNSSDVVSVTAVNSGQIVQSLVNYVLPANLVNLTGTGTAAITLTGNSLNDVITANSGNDTLVAGSGLATLVGGAGNDTFVINNANDVISKSANSGNNTEQSSVSTTLAANVQNLAGTGSGALTLTGNSLSNVITANSGNDTLVAGSGLATLVGGAGNDTFVVNNTSDVVTEAPNSGSNTELTSVTAVLAANVQNLIGTGTANLTLTGNSLNGGTITANSGNDSLAAGSGNETLVSGSGNDTMVAGSGTDTFVVNNTHDTVTVTTANASDVEQTSVSLTLATNLQNLTGIGSANLTLVGNNTADVITGNSGNDVLMANANVTSSSVNDTLVSGSGVDTLDGNLGSDTFYINNSNDVINAVNWTATAAVYSSVSYTISNGFYSSFTGTGIANIVLTGSTNAGSMTITANSGNDTLVAGGQTTTLVGGAGNDTFIIDDASDVISEAANHGNNTEQSAVTITLAANVQNLVGTGGIPIMLTGNSGNDVITGGGGNDTLVAGAGDDTLIAGTGSTNTTLRGGAGNDTFVINNTGDTITATSGSNVNTVQSSVSYTAPTNVQDLFLTGSGSLTATGNSGNDLLIGNTGADTLTGGSGVGVLEAGSGADVLKDTGAANAMIAGAGNDSMTGGTGVSFIAGGAGNDAITLGAGTAVVAFNTGDGAATIAAGTNTSNVLSLGGGIAYANLAFSKSGNNLILSTGGNNTITFTNWYSSSANQDFVTLQVIEQAAATYSSTSSNVLYNSEVETFNFTSLVSAFNSALTANPSLTSWSLSNALLTDHLSSSNTAALGGDLAYYDGLNGNLSGLNLATADTTLQNTNFGKTAQTIDTWSGISSGTNKLH